jgi:hypothetical protein
MGAVFFITPIFFEVKVRLMGVFDDATGVIKMSEYRIHLLVLLLVTVAAVCICGCLGEPEPSTVSGAGTVQYIDLEGGFYGIVGDDGTRYLPLNLPEEFSEDGLAVEFTGYIREDVATIQQWGTPLEITEISTNGLAMKIISVEN